MPAELEALAVACRARNCYGSRAIEWRTRNSAGSDPVGASCSISTAPRRCLAIEGDGAALIAIGQRSFSAFEWLNDASGSSVLRIPAIACWPVPYEMCVRLFRLSFSRRSRPNHSAPLRPGFCPYRPFDPTFGRKRRVTAGYSGTPLARKLSLKDACGCWWDGIPDSVARSRLARRGWRSNCSA